jgi:hypothetical protein
MKCNFDYIHFEFREYSKSGKTKVFACLNNRNKNILGWIRWFPRWRQYCFFPEHEIDVLFSSGCLDVISTFIKTLMEVRKSGKCKD